MRLSLVTYLFLFSLSLEGQAAFEITKAYTISDGLSHNIILRIRQDSRGFLWLGTWEGLNRFDGQEFKKYYHERNNPNSLPHDLVWDILEYKPGMLLIATPNGLGVLNTLTGQFENDKIQFAPLKAGSETVVTKLEKDPDGHIWVNHDGEMDVFDQDLNYLYRFTDLNWTRSIKGISMYLQDWVVDPKGRIWVPSDSSGIIIIDLKAKNILSYKHNPDNLPYFSHKLIRSLVLEGDSIVWVSQWGEGLMKYDIKTGKQLAKLFYENENSQNELLKTDRGTFLFTSFGNCYEFNPFNLTSSRVFEYGKTEESKEHVTFNSISTCRTDSDTYWFGTGDGLFKLNSKIPKTEMDLTHEPVWNSNTNFVFSASGPMYMLGGEKWLVEMDRNAGIKKRFTVPATMTINFPAAITEDPSNHIWIGSEEGVRRFDPKKNTFDIPSFLPDPLRKRKIRALCTDRDGDVWIATAEPVELYSISIATESAQRIPDSILLPFSSNGPMGMINKIKEDKNGNLWMISRIAGGILCHEKKTNQWISFPKSDRNKKFLSKIGLASIWPDTFGYLWLTRVVGDGLIRYDYKKDSLSFVSREDGLLSNDIMSICGDDNGHLWLSSPFGIARYDLGDQRLSGHFSMDYNSLYNEYNITLDPYSQNLVLGGSGKLIFVDPLNMMDTFPPPKPVLDGVTVNKDVMLFDPRHPEMKLDYTQKNISIAFTAINFSNTEKLQFAYTLSGEEEEWTYTTSSRIAQYSLLSPGKYIFKVRVADGSGVWSDSYDLLSFSIRPPFWKSAWFILSAGILIGLITVFLIRRRITGIRQEAALKQKIAETEMMALRAQMNPHFIFNCINSIDALIQSNDKYNATLYLNKFAKLIRNILDSSKMSNMTLAKDLETLRLYIELEQFRNENKFISEIKADPALLQGDYKVPPLIIQPYVENAIIHGLRNRPDNEGKLTLSIKKLDGYIQYIVEDNGVGRKNTIKPYSDEKPSYGMEISSERIRLFNREEQASVTITDLEEGGHPSGTRVEVLLKMI